jgi:acetyl esterase/lipase
VTSTDQGQAVTGSLDAAPGVPGAVSHRGVVFAERRGFRPLLLDVHVPRDADGPVPWVLWIHGGGWENGDRRTTPESWPEGWFYAALVEAGLGVVTTDYRLSAEAVHPAQLEDVRAALAFARGHADVLGLDPSRVGVAGESAGGHLAALLALTAAGGPDAVQAAALLYAVTDLTTEHDLEHLGEHDRDDAPESRMLGIPPERDLDRAADASPVHHVTADAPPTLLVSGDRDAVVPLVQSERLHRALRDAGVADVVLDVVEGADHCFWDVDPLPPLRRTVQFLAARLR